MESILDAFTADKARSFKFLVDIDRGVAQSEITIGNYIFITNNTEHYLGDELHKIYGPGSTGPLLSPINPISGDFILTKSKVRQDGTLLTVENHTFSLKNSIPQGQSGDLSYSVITKSDRVHFIIADEKQNIKLKNFVAEDVTVTFLTEEGEMLRSIYVTRGSQHAVSLQRADRILRLTIRGKSYDMPIQEINVGIILALGDGLIYRPRTDVIEIRERNRKVDVSLSGLKLYISKVRLFIYHDARCQREQDGMCVDLNGIGVNLRRGLIPEFSKGSLSIAECRFSLISSIHGYRHGGSFAGISVQIEVWHYSHAFCITIDCKPCRLMQAFLGDRLRRIEYLSIQCSEAKVRLDDPILSMFVRLFGSRGSAREDACLQDALRAEVENFKNRHFSVRHFVLDQISILLDVHLSKSPWFPIAVDASRYDLLVSPP